MTIPAPIIPIMPTTPAEPVIAKRKPGRPKKVRPQPTADQEAYERAVAEARREALDGDSLLGLLQSDRPDAAAVLHAVTVATAEEQASLLWERMRVEERNGDAQRIASRRIDALAKLAALVLERHKLRITDDDEIRGAQFQKVEQLWMTSISDCAKETLPSETATVFLDRLMAAMASWRASLNSKPNTSP